mmetsp:Transcript_19447/g.45640  ORF Transcript_19447/g.45640 Transcript_19447/m.45640 type:complete len:251 (-) Transcript_19447:46-798(-)
MELRQKLAGGAASLTDLGSNRHGSEPSDSSSDSFTMLSEEDSTEPGSNSESEPAESSSDASVSGTETELSEETFKPSSSLSMDAELLEEESELSSSHSTCTSTPTRNTISKEVQPSLAGALVTTLLVRGLPRNCSRQFLVKHICPPGAVDFLDVPWNHKQRRFCQYCFMNFVSPCHALAFWNRWDGRCLGEGKMKRLDIRPARIQGLTALVKQYLLRGENKPKHLPAVFAGDQQIEFAELLQRLGMQPWE